MSPLQMTYFVAFKEIEVTYQLRAWDGLDHEMGCERVDVPNQNTEVHGFCFGLVFSLAEGKTPDRTVCTDLN